MDIDNDGRNDGMTYDAYIKKEWGSLIGRTITGVREMTDGEVEEFGWERGGGSIPMVYELDNGLTFTPSQDPEGNGPGHIFVEKWVTA